MISQKNIKVILIVPCFNESNRLNPKQFINFSKENPYINFLFVNDGSYDNTSEILINLTTQNESLNHITLEKNLGKGNAIREGVFSLENTLSDFDFIGYLDADLSTPLSELKNLIHIIQNNTNIKFILGIRVARLGAKITRSSLRHYLGRIFATFVSICLKESVYDTQCGAKLIHSSFSKQLFETPFISRWLFDIELIARWKTQVKNYDKTILEYPLHEWTEIKDSKIKVKHFFLAPLELLKIWYTYYKLIKQTTRIR